MSRESDVRACVKHRRLDKDVETMSNNTKAWANIMTYASQTFPDFSINVVDDLSGSAAGRIHYEMKKIEILKRSESLMLFSLAHELGHLLDFVRNPERYDSDSDSMGDLAEKMAYLFGWRALCESGVDKSDKGFWRWLHGRE